MNNVFNNLRIYASKWQVTGRRDFTAEEIAAVAFAEVVASEYGSSVCFTMISGGQTYIPLSSESKLSVGDKVDLSSAKLVFLSRPGDNDITRVE